MYTQFQTSSKRLPLDEDLILMRWERVIERAWTATNEPVKGRRCLHVKLRTALTSISTWGMMLWSRGSREE